VSGNDEAKNAAAARKELRKARRVFGRGGGNRRNKGFKHMGKKKQGS